VAKRTSYYWDASVFIAWIKDEKRDPEEVAGLDAVVGQVDAKRVVLVTSAVILCEVLVGDLDEASTERFSRLFDRPTIEMYDVTRQVAKRAGEIRQGCRRSGIKCPRTPDAIHIATASILGATEIHSFDALFLDLNGKLPQCPIPVCKPHSAQGILRL